MHMPWDTHVVPAQRSQPSPARGTAECRTDGKAPAMARSPVPWPPWWLPPEPGWFSTTD